MRTFDIRGKGLCEPTVGTWYCAFTLAPDGTELSGALGEYVGDGEFYDDDSDVDLGPEMADAEFLVEQH
jgi:hypothetical protein